jgi:hypothetical protein
MPGGVSLSLSKADACANAGEGAGAPWWALNQIYPTLFAAKALVLRDLYKIYPTPRKPAYHGSASHTGAFEDVRNCERCEVWSAGLFMGSETMKSRAPEALPVEPAMRTWS